ncbi:hypothetical protein FU658_06235 [Alkalisalibacterium limincola]|uniref:Uncharacterized protein n=1 Tax=Alkalisalibacterium limincola TaxID=2699169 RepID=A0A5C8KY06_9GAMM|nr:hypothetical protein FU658_06235 [Alkalisalibacterium limincola]
MTIEPDGGVGGGGVGSGGGGGGGVGSGGGGGGVGSGSGWGRFSSITRRARPRECGGGEDGVAELPVSTIRRSLAETEIGAAEPTTPRMKATAGTASTPKFARFNFFLALYAGGCVAGRTLLLSCESNL